MRSAVTCPARSDRVQPFFPGNSAGSPSMNCANMTLGSGRLNKNFKDQVSAASSASHSAICSAVTSIIMPGQRHSRRPATRSPAVVLGAGGVLVLAGLTPEPLTITDSTSFSYRGNQIRGHYGSGPEHVTQLIRLAEAADAVTRPEKKTGNPIRLVLTP